MSQSKLADTRTRAHGWPWVFIIVLCVGAVVFLWRAVLSISTAFISEDYATSVTSALAAAVWIAGCTGIVHNGRRMRYLAFASWGVNVFMSVVGLIVPQVFHRSNPWFEAGSTYYYLPFIGAVAALIWLAWSRPAAVAARQSEDKKK